MINQITVAHRPPTRTLDDILPLGHTINIDSPLVLIVGENGTGKTALLRLIRYSHDSQQVYDAYGVGLLFEEYCHEVRSLDRYQEFSLGGLDFNVGKRRPDIVSNKEGTVDYVIWNSWLKVKEFFPGWTFDPENYGRPLPRDYGVSISPYPVRILTIERYGEIIRDLEAKIKEPSDVNRHGYLKCESLGSGRVYMQDLMNPLSMAWELPTNALRFFTESEGHSRFKTNPFEHESVVNTAGYVRKKLEVGVFNRIDLFFSPDESESNEVLGRKLRAHDFYGVKEIIRHSGSYHTELVRKKEFGHNKKYEEHRRKKAPDDRLVVLMDEPTIALSYGNQRWFMKELQKRMERYKGRLQVFIATNDAGLIEGANNCVYIDMNARPAAAKSSYRELTIAR